MGGHMRSLAQGTKKPTYATFASVFLTTHFTVVDTITDHNIIQVIMFNEL